MIENCQRDKSGKAPTLERDPDLWQRVCLWLEGWRECLLGCLGGSVGVYILVSRRVIGWEELSLRTPASLVLQTSGLLQGRAQKEHPRRGTGTSSSFNVFPAPLLRKLTIVLNGKWEIYRIPPGGHQAGNQVWTWAWDWWTGKWSTLVSALFSGRRSGSRSPKCGGNLGLASATLGQARNPAPTC